MGDSVAEDPGLLICRCSQTVNYLWRITNKILMTQELKPRNNG